MGFASSNGYNYLLYNKLTKPRMNQNFADFLATQHGVFSEHNQIQFPANTPCKNGLYPIAHLSILKVSGADAGQFLQGQLTCNIKELTAQNSFFAGFCNAKGRVISTLLILKQQDAFLIILPTLLLEKVTNKLKMYVLRSKVQLQNVTDEICVSGLRCTNEMAMQLSLPETDFSRHHDWLKLPNRHYLLIASAGETIKSWSGLIAQGFQLQNSQQWQVLDLNAGLAWLDETGSEEYIPQMLNLDKLGGISFNKGCYTGQEVVARTHYLGKAKRELFLAQAAAEVIFADDNRTVIDGTGQAVGEILTCYPDGNAYKILVVLQTSAVEATELKLNNPKQDKISLIPFATA